MINISKKIFVGYSPSKKSYDLPVADIVPDSSHGGERFIRKITQKHTEVHEYDNIPLPGFTLYTNYKRSYGADTSRLVIDPRGFLFNISAENLNNILSVTGITEGLIQEKCVWVRDNSSKNVFLLPVTAEEYDKAVENTEILDQKVKLKDVEIGDYVLLQNELVGKYLGTLTLYGPPTTRGSGIDNLLTVKSYNKRQVIEIQDGKFFASTNAKILKIIQKTDKPLTKKESCDYINNLIKTDPNVYFSSSTDVLTGKYYFSDSMILFAGLSEDKTHLSLKEINKNEAQAILKTLYAYRHDTKLLFEDAQGRKFKLDAYFSFSSSSTNFHVSEVIWSDVNITQDGLLIKKDNNSISFARFNRPDTTKNIDDFVKFYIIEKHVNDQTFI